MPDDKQDTEFISKSFNKADWALYTEIRDKFADKHDLDPKKLSVQTILKTGMTYYAQRLNYIKDEETK